MRMKVELLTMFFVCLITASGALCDTVQGVEQRPQISSGDRALAIWEVQNVMSKHAYYKQVNRHCEEMDDIWVNKDGLYDKTAAWTSQFGVEVGIDQIRSNYCTACVEDMKKTLEKFSKLYPAVKNVPENIGVGFMYFMHTNLTPVIEIAGDGKSAKGIWYSFGLNVLPGVSEDGKTTITTNWAPEKYAVDFVKEDGKWKIWHFVNIFEPGPVEGTQEYPKKSDKPYGARGVLPGEKPATTEGITHYITRTATDLYTWTPTAAPEISPKFPEPYYTFSETFSY